MAKSRPDRCGHNLDGGFCAVHYKGKGNERLPFPCKGFNRECSLGTKRAKRRNEKATRTPDGPKRENPPRGTK